VASVLGVPEQPDQPLTETLAEFLRSKQLLLVLDNCEHLLSACAELVDALLSRSPALRVLATSRQSLGVTGEVAWPLFGLPVPPPALGTAGPVLEGLLQFEAVRLFVERAMAAVPRFSLTERSARPVGEICRRLEGIPLAIELAAARLKALSVEEIAAWLDDRFRLLTGGSRTAQPRQQTLRAAMDWSYELLSPPERLLLQRLAVFAGSFSLNAVEAVCKAVESGQWVVDRSGKGNDTDQDFPVDVGLTTNHYPPSTDVLELLTQLVDKSLVVVDGAHRETRYRLLETVRQYALERLQAGAPESGAGEEERVRRRHLEFYLRLVEEAEPYLAGPDQLAWLERLDLELGNLRAALDGALEREPERALRLAAALGSFWIPRGNLEEARQRLTAALDGAGPGRHSPAGAAALVHLAYVALVWDDDPAAHARYEESLLIQRERHDRNGIATALWGLGHVARRRQEYAAARVLQEESLAIRRELADPAGVAQSLMGLADTVLEQEDAAAARSYYEEALAIRRELGDRGGVASTLGELANVAWRQRDYARAREHREESLTHWRAIGSRLGVIHSLGALGHLARDQGQFEDARAFYTESLHLRRELGDLYTLSQALEDFAELAGREGAWGRTTRLLGAAEALRERMANPLQPRERAIYEQYLIRARETQGRAAVQAQREAASALSLDESTTIALSRQ
jgi:non-specific serine/threonine protein kinase